MKRPRPRVAAFLFRRRRGSPAACVVAALLAGGDAAAGEAETPAVVERVEVNPEADDDATGTLGLASTSLVPADAPGSPSALVGVVTSVPGVSENGQGGLFQNYSVRGLSRQRVTTLVGGMRITSERRAGASASFLDPTLIGRVDVLRGPATTTFGAGALGGVVAVEARAFDGWSAGTGWDGAWDEGHVFAAAGAAGWSVGVAGRGAGDAVAADGSRLHSGFEQVSAAAEVSWERDGRRFELAAIPAVARDVGKANTDFPERTTDYPSERHGLVRFAIASPQAWRLDAAVHAQDLETRVVERDAGLESSVLQDAVDVAVGWRRDRAVGGRWSLRYGLEGFGRRDVDAEETRRDLADPGVPVEVTRALDGASETEAGVYVAARRDGAATRWELAGRWSWIEQENVGTSRRTRDAWSAHAALSRALGPRWEIAGSLSSALRFASLTELYFRGTTGRGQVVGNPQLAPERAFGLEVSARHGAGRTLLIGSIFGTRVEDYVERTEIEPDLFTFVNLTSGTIRGVEIEGHTRLAEPWTLGWGGHWIEGDDDDGATLADTPPAEAWLSATRASKRLVAKGGITLRARREDPGSGEKPIGSAALVWAELSVRLAGGWELGVAASNLLDEEWYASADELQPLAPGRAASLRVVRRAS